MKIERVDYQCIMIRHHVWHRSTDCLARRNTYRSPYKYSRSRDTNEMTKDVDNEDKNQLKVDPVRLNHLTFNLSSPFLDLLYCLHLTRF